MSVGRSVRLSVRRSPIFFRLRKLTNLTNLTPANLTNLSEFYKFGKSDKSLSLQFYLSPLLQTHLCSNELVFRLPLNKWLNKIQIINVFYEFNSFFSMVSWICFKHRFFFRRFYSETLLSPNKFFRLFSGVKELIR